MATKQPRKQAKKARKDRCRRGEQAGSQRQRAPRRALHGHGQGLRRPRPAQQANQRLAKAPPMAADDDSRPTGAARLHDPQPIAECADLATANVPGAERPRASTKRAQLIGMLERPEGASVAEIGQRLGWLPHTVRAAITGLRHAGREVTRSKDATGRSVYRLARVETAPER